MAIVTSKPTLNVRISFEVDESEARALDALAGYGDDAFVKAFYEKLGEAYMKKHEAGLRRFLSSVREVVGPAIGTIDMAREILVNRTK